MSKKYLLLIGVIEVMEITYAYLKENAKTIDQFQEILFNYKFLNNNSSYEEYMKKMRELNIFFEYAMRTGFPFIRMLVSYQFMEVEQLHKDVDTQKRLVDHYKQQAEIAFDTGDKDFDDFRKRVQSFDRYYDYSDDITAYRRGKEQEKEITKIIDDNVIKGDNRYKEYFNYFMKK